MGGTDRLNAPAPDKTLRAVSPVSSVMRDNHLHPISSEYDLCTYVLSLLTDKGTQGEGGGGSGWDMHDLSGMESGGFGGHGIGGGGDGGVTMHDFRGAEGGGGRPCNTQG